MGSIEFCKLLLAFEGKFKDFLEQCVQNPIFNKLAPRTKSTEDRYEGFELVSRFFAYLDNYKNDERVIFFFSGKGTEKDKLYKYIKEHNIIMNKQIFLIIIISFLLFLLLSVKIQIIRNNEVDKKGRRKNTNGNGTTIILRRL